MRRIFLISMLFLMIFVVGCSQVQQPLIIKEVKYIAKFHNNETVIANQSNTWENLPFNIYVEQESTQGFDLNETDNKSILVSGFNGIVRVQGCLHPYNNNIGTVEATIWARIIVNGEEKRCTQASRTKAFRSEGIDILPFAGTIYVEEGDVIELQWKVSNTDIILLVPASEFDNPVSHSINFERMR